ncbi:MAG: hypothetical protein ACRELX_04495 [Longimicrobiales bacterium]
MTWGRSHVRTTEWVLEELYQTGRQWMSESARRKRYAPITTPVMVRKAEGADDVELALDAEQMPLDSELRERFERLFSEFVDRIEGS